MADPNVERYRALLGRQLAMNQQTWRRLQEHGVTPATSLRLDFTYRAPDRASAEALKELLGDQTDYTVEVKSSGGLLRKDWTVQGSTQPTTISAEILDQWVDWMVSAGFERGCEFDGWGTQGGSERS